MVLLVAAFISAGCIQIKKPLLDLGDDSGNNYPDKSGTGTGSDSQQVQRLQYLVKQYQQKLKNCQKENKKLNDRIERLQDQIDSMK